MSQKRHTVDQIIAKLRRADVELGKGKKVPEIRKQEGCPHNSLRPILLARFIFV